MMDSYKDSTNLATQALTEQGIASKKNDIYLQSSEAKIKQFTSTVSIFFDQMINSNSLKALITMATGVVSSLGAVTSGIGLLGTAFMVVTEVIGVKFILAVSKSITSALTLAMANHALAVGEIENAVATGLLTVAEGDLAIAEDLAGAKSIGLLASLKATALSFFGITAGAETATGSIVAFTAVATVGLIAIPIIIGAIVSAFNNAKKAQEAFIKNTQDQITSLKTQQSDMATLSDTYSKLSSNTNRSTDEQKQYLDVQNQIAKISPSLVDHYTSEGDAVLKNTKAIQDYIVELKNQELAKQKGLKDTYIGQIKGETTTQGNDDRSIDNAKFLQEQLSGIDILNGAYVSQSAKITKLEQDKQDSFTKTKTALDGINAGMADYTTLGGEAKTVADTMAKSMESQFNSTYKGNVDAYTDAFQKNINVIKSSNMQKQFTDYQTLSDGYKTGKVTLDNLTSAYDTLKEALGRITGLSQGDIDKFLPKPDTSDINQMALLVQEVNNYADAQSKLETTFQKSETAIKDLDSAITKMHNGESLNANDISDLIIKYPQLAGAVSGTNGVYKINEQALNDLRVANVNEAKTTLETQLNDTENVLNGVQDRLRLYGVEVSAIKDLQSAKVLASQILDSNTMHGPHATGLTDDQKTMQSAIIQYGTLQDQIKALTGTLSDETLGVTKDTTATTALTASKKALTDATKSETDAEKQYTNQMTALDDVMKQQSANQDKLTQGSNSYRDSLLSKAKAIQNEIDLTEKQISINEKNKASILPLETNANAEAVKNANTTSSTSSDTYAGGYANGLYKDQINAVAKSTGVSANLIAGIIETESSFNKDAKNASGHVGLGQFDQASADTVGLKDRTNANESIQAIADLLLVKIKATGSLDAGIMAYGENNQKYLNTVKANTPGGSTGSMTSISGDTTPDSSASDTITGNIETQKGKLIELETELAGIPKLIFDDVLKQFDNETTTETKRVALLNSKITDSNGDTARQLELTQQITAPLANELVYLKQKDDYIVKELATKKYTLANQAEMNNSLADTRQAEADVLGLIEKQNTAIATASISNVTSSFDYNTNDIDEKIKSLDAKANSTNTNSDATVLDSLKEKQFLYGVEIVNTTQKIANLKAITTSTFEDQKLVNTEITKATDSLATLNTSLDTTKTAINALAISNLTAEMKSITDSATSLNEELTSIQNFDPTNLLQIGAIQTELYANSQQQYAVSQQQASQLMSLRDATVVGSTAWNTYNTQLETVNQNIEQNIMDMESQAKSLLKTQLDSALQTASTSIYGSDSPTASQDAQDKIDAEKTYNSTYLTGEKESLSIDKLRTQINNDIINATTTSAKASLQLELDKLAVLGEQSALKQTDLDNYTKELKITEDQIALTNAQNDKNIQIMTQKADGTFDYSYVANQDTVTSLTETLKQDQVDYITWQQDTETTAEQTDLDNKNKYYSRLQTIMTNAENGQYATQQDFQNALNALSVEFNASGLTLSVNTVAISNSYATYVGTMMSLNAQLAISVANSALAINAAVASLQASALALSGGTTPTTPVSSSSDKTVAYVSNGYTHYTNGQVENTPAHANGTDNAQGGTNLVDELGIETKVSGGRLTTLSDGDGILTADITKNLNSLGLIAPKLINFATNPNSFMQNLMPKYTMPNYNNMNLSKSSGITNNYTVGSVTLSKIENPEGLFKGLSSLSYQQSGN